MKQILVILPILLTSFAYGQIKLEYGTPNYLDQKLEKEKFSECIIDIQINYEDHHKDLNIANSFKDREIVVLTTKGKKIKGYLRGFIEVENNIIYFNPIGDHITVDRIPNMIFNIKQMKYYDAECFDEKNI